MNELSLAPTPIYKHPFPDRIGQGEILSNVIRFCLDHGTIGDEQPVFIPVVYEYAIVLTQDCDLEQDSNARGNGKASSLPDILLCQLPTADQLRAPPSSLYSKIWEKIKINKDERYHFLEKTPPDFDLLQTGLPELCIDFKRYFTIPVAEVYAQIESKRTFRRAMLRDPFLQHLSSRFSYFLGRVALPREHDSEADSSKTPTANSSQVSNTDSASKNAG